MVELKELDVHGGIKQTTGVVLYLSQLRLVVLSMYYLVFQRGSRRLFQMEKSELFDQPNQMEKLSASRINTFLRCEMQYFFRYVMDLIRPPDTVPLMVGTQVHKSVEHNMSQKIESHEDLQEGEVLDHFSTNFDEAKHSTVWYPDEKPGEVKDRAVNIVKEHHKVVAPQIQPIHSELEFVMKLTDYPFPFQGFIDIIQEDHTICETKTIGKSIKEPSADHLLQGTLYSLGYRWSFQAETGIRYDYLVKNKKPKVLTFERQVTNSDILYLRTLIDRVAARVTRAMNIKDPEPERMVTHFLPSRGGWICSRRQCGYWELCEKFCGGSVKT